jgi:putative exporter of polyketide antibiotics
MASRSRSVRSELDGENEATELAHITKRFDEETLIRKENLSGQPCARHSKPSLLDGWLLEILSSCSALAVFAGVVAILAIYNGRPNPLWTGDITLNTAISIASILFRVGLMVPMASCISQLSWIWLSRERRPLYDVVRFDQASRSPYGSLQLLFSHHVQ